MRFEGNHRFTLLLVLLSLLLALSTTGSVDAQPVSDKKRWTARKLGGEAMDLFAAGDYDAALKKFEAADELVPAPTIKLRIARCLDKLDRLLDAAAMYRTVIETELASKAPAVHRKARKDAVPELAALNEQIPTVEVIVKGDGAETADVLVDDEPFPADQLGKKHQIDPGTYTFVAERVEDGVTARRQLTLDRGQHEEVVLRFASPDDPQGEGEQGRRKGGDEAQDGTGYRTAGWIALGLGGAGLVVGAVVGVVVLTEEDSLLDRCPERQCPPEAHDDAEQFDTLRTTSTIGLIAGGVGVALGITLLLVAPDGDGEAPAEPKDEAGVDTATLGPCPHLNGLCLSGTF